MRLRLGIVILSPFLALGLQWLLWPWLSPLAWFLFFPAVFFSARLGGLKGGLICTGLSAVIVWYFFIPPQYSWLMKVPSNILSVGMFLLLGYLISEIQGRLNNNQLALQLRESETRFHQIFDSMKSAVAIYKAENDGRDFIFKDFNRAAEQIEQIPRQDVINKNVTQVFPGVADFGLLDVFRRVWKTGTSEDYPISLYKDERIAGWRENHVLKLTSGEIVAIYDDVTTRKQEEEKLKINEATLEQAKKLADLGNWEWDLQKDRHTWSEEIYRMYGLDTSMPPVVYPEVFKYFTQESWQRLSAQVDKGIAEGVPFECDAEVVRLDGTHRWITARGKPVRDDEGNIIRLYGTLQDITERKLMEEELKKHRDRLEEMVKERTAELEAFTYSVSHDLRSPLRGMDGYSKLLLEDYSERLDEEGRFILGQVCESARQMGQLIDDLLNFSRLGRRELHRQSCDMNEIVQKVFLEIRQNHPERHLRMEAADLPVCCGDPAMIREVIRNLLENAAKFTRDRDIAIIEAGSIETSGNGIPSGDEEPDERFFSQNPITQSTTQPSEIIYYIRDNGVGFDMKYRDKLFKVFQRLHRMDEFEGTGIGLALVKRIVQRHDGRIWAEGEPDKGATFYFSLPSEIDEDSVSPFNTMNEKRVYKCEF